MINQVLRSQDKTNKHHEYFNTNRKANLKDSPLNDSTHPRTSNCSMVKD